MADEEDMPSPYGFKRIPVRLLDQKLHGRVIRGYEHRTGLRLVHHKPRSHNAMGYHEIGTWLLCDEALVIAQRFYYGRRQRVGPLQWADREARKYVAGGRSDHTAVSPPKAAQPAVT